MSYTINKRRTQKGLAFDLYYRWKGQRYRPLLGYDLSPDEAEQLAIAMISTIHRGEQAPPSRSPASTLRSIPSNLLAGAAGEKPCGPPPA
jgi:hypothetical protein